MRKFKILIADDEPLNLLLHSEILRSVGYIVITADDGLGAIRMTEIELPDLVILDWNMPVLDGFEALKEIKKMSTTKEIPVIMITGVMTSPENLQSAMDEGAVDFLRKPFDKVELFARVKSILLLSQSTKDLRDKYLTIAENNTFIKSLIDSVPHPMVHYSIDGIILGYNHRFDELLDLKKQNICGSVIYRFLQDSGSGQFLSTDLELLNSKEEVTYECKVGSGMKDFIISKTVFCDSKSNVQGILCVMTDISELKNAHSDLIENNKRELTSSALRLIQVNEMNNILIAELEKLSVHVSDEGSDIIKSIINQFGVNSRENVWSEFEMRFENVYESFYETLLGKFPYLTPGEKKLCALLRLNLSSKDIAAITFQNSQSIDMARYRLRKKLNLKAEVNLIDFLQKI